MSVTLDGIDTVIKSLDTLSNKFDEASGSASEFTEKTNGTKSNVEKLGESFVKVGGLFTTYFTAPILGGMAVLSNEFKNLEYEIARVDTLTSDAFDIPEFTDELIDMSKMIGLDPTTLAQNVYAALTASIPEDEVMDFSMTAHMLATGGFTDEATAIDVLTTAINAYGFEVEEAMKVSDLLIGTQDRGKTTVDELGKYLGDVIPIASDNNLTFEELSASMALLTRNGIGTARATTYIRSMLQELGRTGSRSDEALRELTGKGFRGLMDEGYNLTDVLLLLNDYALENGLTLQDMFGNIRAGTGAMSLLSNEGNDLNELIDYMGTVSGRTNENFDRMTDTMDYRMRVAFNRIRVAGIETAMALTPLWEVLADILEVVAEKAEALAGWFSGLSSGAQKALVVVGGILVMAGPILIFFGKLINSFFEIRKGWKIFMEVLLPGLGKLKGAIGAVFAFVKAHPFVLVASVIIGVVALIIANWETVGPFFQELWEKIKNAFGSGLDWIQEKWNIVWSGVSEFLSGVWESISTTVSAGIDWISTGISTALDWIQEKWNTVWTAIKDFMAPIIEGIVTIVSTGFQLLWSIITNALYFIVGITWAFGEFIWNIIKGVWDLIVPYVEIAVDAIKNTIEVTWNVIKTITEFIWNIIKAVILGVWDGIKIVVEIAVDIVKGIVEAGWNLIKTVTEFIWETIKTILEGVWNGIKFVVETTVDFVKDIIEIAWNFIKDITDTIWTGIKNVINDIWDAIGEDVMGTLDSIKSWISDAWNFISELTSEVWNGIKDTITSIANDIWTAVTETFNNVVDGVKESFTRVYDSVLEGMTDALNAVKNFFTHFRDAGKNIVGNIADGIRGSIGRVTSAISDVTSTIRDWFPFSPPKEKRSPLADLHKNGITTEVARGIYAGEDKVTDALDDVLTVDPMLNYHRHLAVDTGGQGRDYFDRHFDGGRPIVVSVQVDGREIAQATARHTDRELRSIRDSKMRARGGN